MYIQASQGKVVAQSTLFIDTYDRILPDRKSWHGSKAGPKLCGDLHTLAMLGMDEDSSAESRDWQGGLHASGPVLLPVAH